MTQYVHVYRRLNSRRDHLSTITDTTSGAQPKRTDETIAIFAVEGTTPDEATGAVIEWLLRDRPDVMSVRLVRERDEARRR